MKKSIENKIISYLDTIKEYNEQDSKLYDLHINLIDYQPLYTSMIIESMAMCISYEHYEIIKEYIYWWLYENVDKIIYDKTNKINYDVTKTVNFVNYLFNIGK